MLKSYFKTAWRNLFSNKTFSLLNIFGLGFGMAVALLIGLWVQYQFSYDRYLPDSKQVYKVGKMSIENDEKNVSMVTPLALANVLKEEVPGIRYVAATDWLKPHGLSMGEKKLYVKGAMAGSDFLNIFKYPIVKGNPNQILRDPYSIVLTESSAIALFGINDPVGKTVRIDNSNDLKVTGVIKNIPENSTLQFNFIVPYEFYVQTDGNLRYNRNNWEQTTSQIYISLQPNVTNQQVQPALKKIFAKYAPKEYATSKTEVILQPLKDWHLFADYKNGVQIGGFIDYVKLFALIGMLVLMIACINFVNLSTAKSEKRAKEVGVRKAIGSSRIQLISQFMVESLLLAFGAFILALGIVIAILPAFNQLTGTNITLPYLNIYFWLTMAGYVLITGLLAGSRPAFQMSSLQTVKVLKGTMHTTGKTNIIPRKSLVVVQFTCSIALIISTVTIYQQIQHAKNRPTGFDTKALIMTDANLDLKRNYEALKNELLASGTVIAVTKSSSPVTDNWNFNSIDRWPGKQDDKALGVATVGVSDKDYFATMGMQLVAGRNFEGKNDSLNVIINEAAVKAMGLQQPLNQIITWDGSTKVRVVGIIKNAIMESPFADVKPMLFSFNPDWSNIISYRISPRVSTQDALLKLTPIFTKYNPAIPYLYKFVDESYAIKFKAEVLIGNLAAIFAALAIFISCLGLFGLGAFTAEQRTKEIGIRKVLGASAGRIWLMLSGEFVGLVGISALTATPIALYFLNDWLSKYSYRISLTSTVFIFTALGTLAITLVTVSFQSVKAALSNPIKTLRTA